jgi:hypothetical protein
MPTQAPSGAALESGQRGLFAAAPQLVNLRSQVAVVRTLADQVEQLSRAADFDGPGAQMVEEMARLGCRLIDAAAALADASQLEDSGVFKRAAMLEAVHWETPTYDLVRMDAEIGSYQEDQDPGREAPSFLSPVVVTASFSQRALRPRRPWRPCDGTTCTSGTEGKRAP